MSENQRKQQRFDRRLEIEVAIGERRASTFTRNLSLGGVFVESAERPPFGTRVQLKFKVPTQKEMIDVGGVIRWHDGSGFGVQFDGLRARDVWALGKFFEQP
jgi:hypothetical protein